MRNSKIIGGEFEIRPEFIKNLNLIDKKQSYTSYSSGRAALFSILENIGKNVIFVTLLLILQKEHHTIYLYTH